MTIVITLKFLIAFFIFVFPPLSSAISLDDIFFSYNVLNSLCQNRTQSRSNCSEATLLTFSEASNVTLLLKLFGDIYTFYLVAYESSIFSSDAVVIVEEENDSKWTVPSSNFQTLPIYEGTDTNGTYICCSIINNTFRGFFMLGNGSTIYIESLEIWNLTSSNESFELVAYKASDVKFRDCNPSPNNRTDCHENGFSGSLHCKRENKRQITCFLNANESKNILQPLFASDHLSSKTTRKPPFFTLKNASCTILLSADSSFYAHHGYELENTLIDMILILKHVNRLLSLTDFDSDGYQDDFALRIGEVAVMRNMSLAADHSISLNEKDLSILVKRFREEPQDVCLSLQFISVRTISNWMSLGFGGGICKNNDKEPEPAKNVAIVNTVDSQGVARPLMATAWIVTMAVGHVLGSAERVCDTLAPYPPETDWTSFFTDCGRHNIANLLERQGSCLEYPEEEMKYFADMSSGESQKTSCGNRKVDPGEECDCGSKEECSDKSSCCIPPGQKNECQYDRDKGYECDWSDDCCTQDCKIIPESLKVYCGYGEPSCSPSGAYCNGHEPHCPVSRSAVSLRDGEMCGPATLKHVGAATCKEGNCNGTVCQDADLEDCICAVESGQECRVCCKKPATAYKEGEGKDILCVPAEYFGLKPKNQKFFYRFPGTPCSEVRFGHCNRYGACTQIVGVSRASVMSPDYYSATCSLFLFLLTCVVLLEDQLITL